MGLTSEEALGAAISYVKKTLAGMGALKGANCQIQSITYDPSARANTVVFLWKDNNDVSHTSQMVINDGGQGQFISGYTVSGVAPYRRNWLEDENGVAINPAKNLFYVVMSEGDYYKTLLFFDEAENTYVSIAAGGSGTEDYEQLVNLPQINGVELKGNKSPVQLGFGTVLTLPISNTITSKTGLIAQLEYLLNTVTDFTQEIQIINHADIMDISEVFLPAGTVIKGAFYAEGSGNNQRFRGICFDINGNTHVLSFNYSISDNEISNFQLVNLVGLSTNDYDDTAKGIVDGVTSALAGKADVSSVPTKTSDLTNDSGFITNTVNNLINYYLKTETYSKTEVDALLQAITTLDIQAVAQLPTTNISTTTIYLVPKQDPQVPDIKAEYINLDGTTSGWELIGNTQIDLSNYVTDAELTAALQNYVTTSDLTTALADYATLDNSGAFPDANTVTKELVYINGYQSGLKNYPSGVSNTVGILFTRWFYYSGDLTVARMQLIFTIAGTSFCRFTDGTSWTPWESTSVGFLSNLTTTDKSSAVAAINEVNGKLIKTQTVVSLDSTYYADTDWNIVKQGNICVLNMRNLKDIPTGITVIGTIPVGFRPEWGFYEYVYAANKDVHLGFNIADNGDIQILNNTGTALSGTVYVNRNVTYFTA